MDKSILSHERRRKQRPVMKFGAGLTALAALAACSGQETIGLPDKVTSETSVAVEMTAPDEAKIGAACIDLTAVLLDDGNNIVKFTPVYTVYGGATYHSMAYSFNHDGHTVFVTPGEDETGSLTHDFPDDETTADVRAFINFSVGDRAFGSTGDCELTVHF